MASQVASAMREMHENVGLQDHCRRLWSCMEARGKGLVVREVVWRHVGEDWWRHRCMDSGPPILAATKASGVGKRDLGLGPSILPV